MATKQKKRGPKAGETTLGKQVLRLIREGRDNAYIIKRCDISRQLVSYYRQSTTRE